MGFLLHGLEEALVRIGRLDRELLMALATTLKVSVTSTALASILSLPIGFVLASRAFPGKPLALALLKTALAFPTVVVGLFVYAFLARSAPLGSWGLLFTPAAIVVGQVILITPLITALVYSVLQTGIQTVYEEALLLGASPLAAFWKTLLDARVGVSTALMTGFGRVVSEIGVSLILGGNIRGVTRTMTTAIALEAGQGDFPLAIALGIALLFLVLLVNLGIQVAERQRDAL